MIDLNLVRINIDEYKKNCRNKNSQIDVDRILDLDEKRKNTQQEIDSLKNKQKKLWEQKDYEWAKILKNNIQEKELEYQTIIWELENLKLKMPNFTHKDVPIWKDESWNIVKKEWWIIPTFDFQPIDHIELMQLHDMIDIERWVKLWWARSYFLKNDWMLLEQAILQYTLKKIINKWFIPMSVPNIVKTETLIWTWYFPWWEEDTYNLTKDEKRLIATSEIPLTAYYSGEILEEKDFPKKFVWISPCYRREAWSYWRDTSGLYRVHQFNKVEQVIIIPENESLSNERHQKILENSMEILESLEIPHRLLQLCTGDLSIWKYISHDLECWMPSRNNYGETHSASSFLDFQARRLNLRYRDSEWNIKYCYTLNNTAIATPRILISIVENNQTSDKKIIVPKVLRDYIWKDIIW